MKQLYEYSRPLLSEEPYSSVEVNHKNFLGRCLCHHHYQYLVMQRKDAELDSLLGDTIGLVCVKCGKVKGTPRVWEYEGMGYK